MLASLQGYLERSESEERLEEPMHVKDSQYEAYRTARQWALQGQLPCENTDFDIGFLRNNSLILPDSVQLVDVMEMFAPIYGEWSDY